MLENNLTAERPTFTTHLECGMEGDRYEADTLHGLSKAGKPLLVRYDLDAVKSAVSRDDLEGREPDFWRYRELLPVRRCENIVSLGESMTPIVELTGTQRSTGINGQILVKDEGRLPTGSFKARGLCMAVCMAKELGVTRMAMPTKRQCGFGARGLLLARRDRVLCFLPGRHARSECPRDRASGRQGLEGQRPDQRLRQDCRRGQGGNGLVRHLDPQGALPDRRQEDHGAGNSPSSSAGKCRM